MTFQANTTPGRRWPARLAFLLLPLAACDSPSEPRFTVDVDALFAPATSAEIAAVRADWATRSPEAVSVRTETELMLHWGPDTATAHIISHLADGFRHYGAVVVPRGATEGSLPVLVYAHGGDQGVTLEEVQSAAGLLGDLAGRFAVVVPSFRSEPIGFGTSQWTSEGAPSHWDRDVDDALALVEAAIQVTPEADPDRRAVLGLSRGGAVAMLMAIRDPRIDRVVEFFGPTDFFGPYVREIAEEALAGEERDLPGFDHLNATLLQPLARGDTTVQAVRLELVRRSAVLFADELPTLQLHHGTEDALVDVSQAERLIEVMGGRSDFEGYIYPGGGHHPLTLGGSGARTVAFLAALLAE